MQCVAPWHNVIFVNLLPCMDQRVYDMIAVSLKKRSSHLRFGKVVVRYRVSHLVG